jgi:hypothetical protein
MREGEDIQRERASGPNAIPRSEDEMVRGGRCE